jgi:heme oxygenase (biliverdin-producing, ferredoxin)
MNASLAERLRRETRDLHGRAERAGAMARLLRGQLALAPYCAMLRNLHALYASLEAGLARHAADPAVKPVYFPQYFREAAIAADLVVLHGPSWQADFALQPTTLRYVERLDQLAQSDAVDWAPACAGVTPALLAAHAYVRYLGDLNGGQVLKRRVGRSIGAKGEGGLSFYDFGEAEDIPDHIAAFRAGLDAIADVAGSADRIVAEARLAFEWHVAIFEELDQNSGRAQGNQLS